MQWIGLTVQDWTRYSIPSEALLPLSIHDRKRGISMLSQSNDHWWNKEMQKILMNGRKAELQALTMYDSTFLTQSYLPHKLHYIIHGNK